MDEQKLKDIEAPKKEGGVTLKQKRINTYIFTAVSSILNLFFITLSTSRKSKSPITYTSTMLVVINCL